MRPPTTELYRGVFRAIVPQPDAAVVDFQQWFADHQNYRWNVVQKLTNLLVSGDISPDTWADAFDQILLEGHSNSWWIGRALGGQAGEYGDDDLQAGLAYKDAEADYLQGFLDKIKSGAFSDDNGKLIADRINNRARLYLNKFRSTANDAFVDASPLDAKWIWRLGGNEEHCTTCPALAAMSEETPFLSSDLPTTPGGGGTECLTNCLCHLERVVNGVSLLGLKPVRLQLIDNESSQAA